MSLRSLCRSPSTPPTLGRNSKQTYLSGSRHSDLVLPAEETKSLNEDLYKEIPASNLNSLIKFTTKQAQCNDRVGSNVQKAVFHAFVLEG